MKNIIFAAIGPKPEIVIDDAVNNDLRIVKNEQNCLIYDRPLTAPRGLTWRDLAAWWADREKLTGQPERVIWRSLYRRLLGSIDTENGAERRIFTVYGKRYGTLGADIPALLPQVYLHYDPYTRVSYRPGTSPPLPRQRMDFLLLLPDAVRIVLEVDGKQHYANGEEVSPQLYSEMTAEDRRLRLRGYEVYRFGGFELSQPQPQAAATLRTFFDDLFEKHLPA